MIGNGLPLQTRQRPPHLRCFRPDSEPKRYSKVGETSPARCAGPVDFRAGGDELASYEAQYHTQAAVA